jgi:hypothetical protein
MSDELEPELERIAQMLRDAGPLPDAPATLRERALSLSDGAPQPVAEAPDGAATAPARVRPRSRPRTGVLLGIAAAIAALVIVPTAIITHGDGSGEQDIALASRPFAPNGGGTAAVIPHSDGSTTISIKVWKLPRSGSGRVYETWLGRKGDRRPLGAFQVGSDGKATISYEVPRGKLDGYRWLWVTSEPAGSHATPSDRTALWGPLT